MLTAVEKTTKRTKEGYTSDEDNDNKVVKNNKNVSENNNVKSVTKHKGAPSSNSDDNIDKDDRNQFNVGKEVKMLRTKSV